MGFFVRKQSNRRLGRRELLDVKARSALVRRRRLHWSALAFGLSFGTILFVYLAWRTINWSLDKLVYQNPAYAINRIDVYTDGVISPEQIRQWSGVRPGQNLLALDLSAIKLNLERVPHVKLAAVERVLPHTLRIRVVEREPLAVVYAPYQRASGGFEMHVLFLDEDGYVLPPLCRSQSAAAATEFAEQYPVIVGIDPAELMPGKRLDLKTHRNLKAALDLVIAFDRSQMVGLDSLQRIDISSAEVLEVATRRGTQVTFPVSDPARQLRRWHEICELGRRLGRTIESVDLAVSDNIPVRWVQVRPSQTDHEQSKHNHTRRRDV